MTASDLDLADALRAAINVLRDCVESRRMPSGEILKADALAFHAAVADLLAQTLADLKQAPPER